MNKAEIVCIQTITAILTFAGFVTGCLSLPFNTKVAYIALFIGALNGCLTVLANGMKEMEE